MNSGIRRIAVATQYKAHSLIRHLQRGWNFFRPERNESFDILPASQRVSETQWYAGTADAVYPEHRHHRQLRPALHRRPGRRPCLQDGLRADAAAARRARRRRDGRLPRGAARGGDRLRRHACRRAATASSPSSRSRPTRRRCRASRTWRWPAWASTCSTRDSCSSCCARDAADPHSQPRFRQGHHPRAGQGRQGGRAPLLAAPACAPRAEAEAYWRDVGTVDAYCAANIDLTDVVPELDLYDRDWPIWTYARDDRAGQVRARRGGRRGQAVSSLVSGGCIVSGASLRRSLLFTGVHVHSYAEIEEAVILPDVDIGRHARLQQRRRRPRRADPARARGRRGPGAGRAALPPHRGGRLPDHREDDRPAGELTPDGGSLRRLRSLSAGQDRRARRCGRRAAGGAGGGGRAGAHAAARLSGGARGAAGSASRPACSRISSAARRGCWPARAGGLDLFVLDAPHLYDRPGSPYAGPDGSDWPDNALRFAALARPAPTSALGLLPAWRPEVVHAHDWQAGLLPAYLTLRRRAAAGHRDDGAQPGVPGPVPAALLATLGLPPHSFANRRRRILRLHRLSEGRAAVRRPHHHRLAHLRGRNPHARRRHGARRAAARARRRGRAAFSTASTRRSGTRRPTRCSPRTFDAPPRRRAGRPTRRRCRRGSGSRADATAPLFAVISRLTWQKGMDLLLAALPALLAAGGQLALLGTGDAPLEAALRAAAAAHPGRVGCGIGYDEHARAPDPGRRRRAAGALALRAVRADPALRAALRRGAGGRARRRPRRHGDRRQRRWRSRAASPPACSSRRSPRDMLAAAIRRTAALHRAARGVAAAAGERHGDRRLLARSGAALRGAVRARSRPEHGSRPRACRNPWARAPTRAA